MRAARTGAVGPMSAPTGGQNAYQRPVRGGSDLLAEQRIGALLPRIGWARVEAVESCCQVFGVAGDVPAIRA